MAKERSMINLCVLGCPPTPVYKGGREEEAGPRGARHRGGGNLLQVGFPPFSLSYLEGEGKSTSIRK